MYNDQLFAARDGWDPKRDYDPASLIGIIKVSLFNDYVELSLTVY